jgi:beta-galactosidase
MKRQSFNAGWLAGLKVRPFAGLTGPVPVAKPVTLPYDAIRDLPRSADSDQGSHNGYFPGGCFVYTKTFDMPEEYRGRIVTIEFEGVYRDAMVFINGEFAAQRPNGYAGFAVKADPYLIYGQRNTISVEARSHQDSRWYTGAGIYRNVNLIVSNPVHVALDGVRITTPDIDPERAIVAVATTVENETRFTRTVRLDTRVVDPHGIVAASGSASVTLLPNSTAVSRVRLAVRNAQLWSPDSPALYEINTTVADGDDVLDREHIRFGIRRLQLDPEQGLRINGEPVNLRGACVHHDAGALGAAAISRAEVRRVEILKEAGFNAIRSAHNPISRATLQACDRLGVLVMDELTDVWTEAKSPFDYTLSFPEWWERDLEAMVAKDFNHPSVIMYSIGNEIFEVGTPIGSTWGRKLAEKVRSLDDTRFVTNAINGMVAVMDRLGEVLGGQADEPQDVNTMIATLGDAMNQLSASEPVTEATEESAAMLDVVGFNYGDSRHEPDTLRFPNRVIVGSETFPGHIDELWRLVRANPHVVGDFTWTGWDYLGEAGLGRVDYPDDDVPNGIAAPYPWLTGGCGDIDITGQRRPISYYREIVYGLRNTPYIAVQRPQFHSSRTFQTPWSWTDSVASWSWDVPKASPVVVDVYSGAEEVDLILNGRSLGRQGVGVDKAYLARFHATYEPGELLAVSYTAGEEQARTTVFTAGDPVRLVAISDRDTIRADDHDLAYITVTLRDDQGNIATHRDRLVHVQVGGAGVLAGLGTGRQRTEEPFGASQCTTFDGCAVAIIRPTSPGTITIQVSAEGCEPGTVMVSATDAKSEIR